ncbi:MAG: DUF87 domain-containing protein [Candidatus Brocadiae bacterium]|nr:DUF87 domain-containing protein [Candidatus Brocadiia bacterium]
MQPLKLYIDRDLDHIPQEVDLGYTGQDDIVSLTKEDLGGKHIYILGTTGSGKSRCLALFLQQILSKKMGRVIFIDPLGEVYHLMLQWYAYLAREYYMQGESQFRWFNEAVLRHTLFWDLSDESHLLRHNPLKHIGDEPLSRVISRLIKFFDNLFSDESGASGMELQLQRRENLVALISVFSATDTQLEQAPYFIYNQSFRENLLQQAEQKSNLPQVQRAVNYFRFLDDGFQRKWAEKVISMETGISPFFESEILRKFLLTAQNNVDFSDILASKTLFIKAPAHDLPTKKILFNYLYTVFFDLADRRKPGDTVYLGSDESSLVFNATYADTITRIRNKNVLLISAHQAKKQLLTNEGIRIAETIASQSNIKMYFRNDYDEAEKNVDDIFTLTGKFPKLIEVTTTVTQNSSESSGSSLGENATSGKSTGMGQSIQEGVTETGQRSYSVSDSMGITQSIQKQWAEAEGTNDTKSWNIQDTFTYSESVGHGLTQLRGQGVTFSFGQGRSLMRIDTKSGAVTIAEGEGTTETTSESSGFSEGTGASESFSKATGRGTTLSYHSSNGGQVISITEGSPIITGGSSSSAPTETLNRYENLSRSTSMQKSQSRSTMQGIASSLNRSLTHSKTEGHSSGESKGITHQESVSLARQFSESANLARQYAQSIQKALGHSESLGTSQSHTRTIGDSVSQSMQRAIQQGESLALSTARNWGANLNRSWNEGISYSRQHSYNLTAGISLSIAWKIVYYTMEEEKRLLAQDIHTLPRRFFYLGIGGSNPTKVLTGNCFDLPTRFGQYDFFSLLYLYYHHLPAGQSITLFPSSFPEVPVQEARIYPSLPPDFAHFFPRSDRKDTSNG